MMRMDKGAPPKRKPRAEIFPPMYISFGFKPNKKVRAEMDEIVRKSREVNGDE